MKAAPRAGGLTERDEAVSTQEPARAPSGRGRVAELGHRVSRLSAWFGARAERWPAWVATCWALVLLTRIHALYLTHPDGMNIDEGYISAFGMRMLDGQLLPYVDAISQRGPVLYWIAALLVKLGGYSWLPVRIVAFASFVITAICAFLAGRRAGAPVAGALGAIAVPIGALLLTNADDGISFNGETALNAFVLPAFLALTHGLASVDRPPRVGWVAAAGALAALGALTKQVGIVALAPMGLWVLAAALGRPGLAPRDRRRLVLAYVGAAIAPFAAVLGLYAAAGELDAFVYWFWTYNSTVYVSPFVGKGALDIVQETLAHGFVPWVSALVAIAWAVGQLVLRVPGWRGLPATYDRLGFSLTVALGAAAALFGARAGLREYGHYYIQAIPWLGLLAGLLLTTSPEPVAGAEPARRGRLQAFRLLVLLPALVAAELVWAEQRPGREQRVQVTAIRPAVCDFVAEHSRPDERIFVWGFFPELHVWCERKPASRYVYSVHVAGIVPWFHHATKEEDDARAVPGSRRQVIEDLERWRTPLIIEDTRRMPGRPMRRYDELAAYVDEHYYRAGKFGELIVYLRGKTRRRPLFDLEGPDPLAGWERVGAAFADPIAESARPGQRTIAGWQGRAFVNTFASALGDAAQGRALSPSFVIDRDRLAFLAAGGPRTAVRLLVDDDVAYTYHPPTSSVLTEVVWNVARLRGRTARFELSDPADGSWGHLMFDRIELFDASVAAR